MRFRHSKSHISNSKNFNGFRLLSGPAMTDHRRRALLRRHVHQTRRCGCYRRHTPRTPLPRPIMAADLGPNVSAAAAAACMSAGGRVWWWAVSRSPAQEHPQRAAALVPTRPPSPPVCVEGRWTSVDVAVPATGCCRGATTDGSAHTRGRQDQPNDKDFSGLGCQQTPFRQPSAIHGS